MADKNEILAELVPEIRKDHLAWENEKRQGGEAAHDPQFGDWLSGILTGEDDAPDEVRLVKQAVNICNESYLLDRAEANRRIHNASLSEENRKASPDNPPLDPDQRDAETLEAASLVEPTPDALWDDDEDDAIRVVSPETAATLVAAEEDYEIETEGEVPPGPDDSQPGEGFLDSTETLPATFDPVEIERVEIHSVESGQPPTLLASHATIRVPRKPQSAAKGVEVFRRRLALAAPGADARIVEEIQKLEAQMSEIAKNLEVLKASVVSSTGNLNEVRTLLQATAVRANILPGADITRLEEPTPLSARVAEANENDHSSPDKRWKPASVLATVGSLVAVAFVLVMVSRGAGDRPEGSVTTTNSQRLAMARKAAQYRAAYLRREKHELEVTVQILVESEKLLAGRRATLERLKSLASVTPMAIQRAEQDVQEAEAIQAESQQQGRRAEINLRRVAAALPNG